MKEVNLDCFFHDWNKVYGSVSHEAGQLIVERLHVGQLHFKVVTAKARVV
jgi:hypothetical protein